MNPLHFLCLALVAAAGTAVVLAREPGRQAIMLSLYGMLLTVLFLVLQSPDVALSELAVGGAALPLMILVALANVRADEQRRAAHETTDAGESA